MAMNKQYVLERCQVMLMGNEFLVSLPCIEMGDCCSRVVPLPPGELASQGGTPKLRMMCCTTLRGVLCIAFCFDFLKMSE